MQTVNNLIKQTILGILHQIKPLKPTFLGMLFPHHKWPQLNKWYLPEIKHKIIRKTSLSCHLSPTIFPLAQFILTIWMLECILIETQNLKQGVHNGLSYFLLCIPIKTDLTPKQIYTGFNRFPFNNFKDF